MNLVDLVDCLLIHQSVNQSVATEQYTNKTSSWLMNLLTVLVKKQKANIKRRWFDPPARPQVYTFEWVASLLGAVCPKTWSHGTESTASVFFQPQQ